MAGFSGEILIRVELRPCVFRGREYKFHKWFSEGSEDGIDECAILEDADGKISKVWHLDEIRFIDKEMGADAISTSN